MCNIEVKTGTTLKIFNVVGIMVMVVSFPPSVMDYVMGLELKLKICSDMCYSSFKILFTVHF